MLNVDLLRYAQRRWPLAVYRLTLPWRRCARGSTQLRPVSFAARLLRSEYSALGITSTTRRTSPLSVLTTRLRE